MLLLLAQLCILVVLAVLNIWFGIVKDLYNIIWWWDIPTHFLGGVWAGVFTAWYLQHARRDVSILYCALGALSVGLIWEVFEAHFSVGTDPFMPYWLDTCKDLLMDTVGGSTAGLAIRLQRQLWLRK